jgi:hypothetical protein
MQPPQGVGWHSLRERKLSNGIDSKKKIVEWRALWTKFTDRSKYYLQEDVSQSGCP